MTMDEDGDIIVVNMHCHTSNREAALRVVETFSRMMVGLALDSIDVSINVSVLDEEDYYEPEHEEVEHDEEEE